MNVIRNMCRCCTVLSRCVFGELNLISVHCKYIHVSFVEIHDAYIVFFFVVFLSK